MCWPASAGPRSGAERRRVRAVAVSSWSLSSVAATQRFRSSGIALLQPGVAVVVVAEALPEPRPVVLHEREGVDPLRALPEVEVRHQQPGRAAVLRRAAARRRTRTRSTPARRRRRPSAGSSCSRRSCPPSGSRASDSTPSSSLSTETPRQWVPNFDQLVTQWMSVSIGSGPRSIRSCHDHCFCSPRLGGEREPPVGEPDALGRSGGEHREAVLLVLPGRQRRDSCCGGGRGSRGRRSP